MEQRREEKRKQIAIVTGASSGLGREFALQIARRYPALDAVWAVARRGERLKELEREEAAILPVCADLLTEDGMGILRKKLEEERPKVRLLVLGAGCGFHGRLREQSQRQAEEMIALNIAALTQTLLAALPHIPPKSRILAIASASAFLPQPGFAVYGATKAYVRYLCQAFGQEMRRSRVTVTAVCPGPVDTEFFERAGQEVAPWKKRFLKDAALVAEKALRDADRGRAESVYGCSMKAVRLLAKFAPQRPLLWIMGKFV